MQLMKELWDEKGYAVSVSDQNLRDQNLRDKAARIENNLGDITETITNKVGRRIEAQDGSGEVEGTHQFIYTSEIINSESSALWEDGGTGENSVQWLADVRRAIENCVPESSNEEFSLDEERARKVITKKRNWSAPGPDRIDTFWWKKVKSLHKGVVRCLQEIGQGSHDIPLWFTEGKTSLLPKPGEFCSENRRPTTCLNTI